MELSARNQLKGTVRSVAPGTIMSEVIVDIGGQDVVAAITRGSVERLGLREGAEVRVVVTYRVPVARVRVVIKSTDVMIAVGS